DHTHDEQDHEFVEQIKKPSTALFAAASLVPCTGSMIILLFTLANDILWAGVLAVLAIALGMWMTVTIIGFVSILLRRMVVGENENPSAMRSRIGKILGALAALI